MKPLKIILLSLIAFSGLSNLPALAQDGELLPPEQAFALTAWMEDGQLIAEYRIADGYYMYRERFDFQVETDGASFDTAIIPDGKIKNDEFFGDMEVYRNSVKITLPIIKNAATPAVLKVRSTGQGCADIGVCYPPLQQSLTVDTGSSARFMPVAYTPPLQAQEQEKSAALQMLLAEATGAGAEQNSDSANLDEGGGSALDLLKSLGDDIGLADDDEIPHPDEAFRLSATLDKNNIIRSEILMKKNIYLYRDKVKIDIVEGSGHTLSPIGLPRGKKKTDEFLGDTEVFYDLLQVLIPVTSAADASESYTLSYQYQGCVEDRICYPPITKYLNVNSAGAITISDQFDKSGQAKPVTDSSKAATLTQQPVQGNLPQSEQDEFAGLLQNASLLSILLFYLAGVGLTFTPCVFPMIPILSSIIAGQGEDITTSKAFSLSAVYVLSMAITYAVVGAIVGYYGAEFNIQVWFQDPVILSIFAGIFVLLALSMFGFYDIQMPAAIQSRLTAISNSQQGGTMIGVGLMGLFSAIIVGPCITAPLVGALIFISQTQDWQLGGLALFALGLGMGTPLLAIGTSAGKLLPRAGGWMDGVKSFFGVALLAVAIWLLERILPVSITMGLIAALLITSAIYMGALATQSGDVSGWQKLNKGIGIILLLYGSAYLVGAVSGSNDLLQPLRGFASAGSGPTLSQKDHIQFRQIKGEQGLQLALTQSVASQQNTMLDFYADWCISCKEMERYAFTHPQVLKSLENVVTLQSDVTDYDEVDTQLLSSLGIYGPPAILFFDKQGREIRHRRVVGEMSGEEFAEHIIGTL